MTLLEPIWFLGNTFRLRYYLKFLIPAFTLVSKLLLVIFLNMPAEKADIYDMEAQHELYLLFC